MATTGIECLLSADELLFNAALHREDTHDLLGANEIHRRLWDEYPESLGAKSGLWRLAVNLHSMAMYDAAARAFLRFARVFPGEVADGCGDGDIRSCPDAKEALLRAFILFTELRNRAQAARLFARNYSRRYAAEVADVIASLGAFYEREERWRDAIVEYEQLLRRDLLALDVAIATRVAVARAQQRLGRARRGEAYLHRAVELWEQGLARPSEEESSEDALMLHRARETMAEAHYRLAELARLRFENGPRAPRSRASGPALVRWTQTRLHPYIERRMRALKAVEVAYAPVAAMQSRRWMIASARRIAEMHLRFADELEPRASDMVATLLTNARDRLEYCFVTARETGLFSHHSSVCAERLMELDDAPHQAELFALPMATVANARPGPV